MIYAQLTEAKAFFSEKHRACPRDRMEGVKRSAYALAFLSWSRQQRGPDVHLQMADYPGSIQRASEEVKGDGKRAPVHTPG